MVTYSPMRPPVGISGIGVVSPFGTSCEVFRDALLDGRTGIAPVRAFDTRGCRTTLAAAVSGFDPAAWISPMKLRRMDPTAAYAIVAARIAIENTPPPSSGDDSGGVVLGTWSAGGPMIQEYLGALFRSGPAGVPGLVFNSTVGNAAASLAGLEFKLRGPNTTISHKEASGLAAVVTAVNLIRERRAAWLVTGGVDTAYEIFFKAHDRVGVMSPRAAFSSRSSPFDRHRDGFVMGEGGFALRIQSDDLARGALAAKYGDILGIAASGSSVRINAWPDRPAPLTRTMRLALEDAGLRADDVDVVYASANATPELDRVEAQALLELFGDTRTVVTSIKGAIGEFGASGAAACAAALLCGRVGRVPPITGFSDLDPSMARLRLARESMQSPGQIVLINSFASGGALFSLVLRVAS
jgi:3-oxoacyl-[acyl-carrier-protein] synthase II